MSQISNIKKIRNCVIKIGSGALYLQVFFLYSISDKQHIILVLHSCKMAKFRFPSIYCCPTPLWYGNPLPNLGRNLGSWGSKKSGFTLKCQIGHNLPLNSAAKRFSGVSGTTQFSFKLSHRQKMTDCLHTHFHLQVSLLCSPPANCLQVVCSSIMSHVNLTALSRFVTSRYLSDSHDSVTSQCQLV